MEEIPRYVKQRQTKEEKKNVHVARCSILAGFIFPLESRVRSETTNIERRLETRNVLARWLAVLFLSLLVVVVVVVVVFAVILMPLDQETNNQSL